MLINFLERFGKFISQIAIRLFSFLKKRNIEISESINLTLKWYNTFVLRLRPVATSGG